MESGKLIQKKDVIIRPVHTGDAGELARIYRPYVENTAVSYEITAPDADEFERRIQQTKLHFPYLAAEIDGKIVGYAYAHPYGERAGYRLTAEPSIYVDRAYRRSGIGRMLYEELERLLKEQGIHSMVAVVAAPETDNDPYLTRDSQKFHERMGFVKAGELHQCGRKFDRWYNIMHMEKLIDR